MNENQTRLDAVIDRAVRDIMRRDPPAGLRSRVLSRLDAPARRVFAWPQLATAAAAVAAVAIAVVMLRDAPPVPSPASSAPQPVAASQPASVPAGPSSAGSQPPARTTPAGQPRRQAAPPEPVRTATFGPRDGRIGAANLRTEPAGVADRAEAVAVDAPEPLPPAIVVDALGPMTPLQIAPIVVAPIQIPRIQVAPVPPPR